MSDLVKRLRFFAAERGVTCRSDDNILSQAADRIEELENPWVSVKDRLPDDVDGLYLTLSSNKGYQLHLGFQIERLKNADFVHVTHWMPLPSPPEEES